MNEILRSKTEQPRAYLAVLDRIKPSPEETRTLKAVSAELLSKINAEGLKADKNIRASILGSVSRGTWLRNEKDIDVFMTFPLKYERGVLERVVTSIGRKILKNTEKRYAEHPYIKGTYKGFEVEIVPCYGIDSPGKVKSAVDRTPFHDEFVKKHIGGREDEVRLLKQFLTGIGCYGAEAKVEGFSGYLCELLIIKYGTFKSVLEAAQEWKPGEAAAIGAAVIQKEKFSSPLIFIDPVDQNRNTAAALSSEKFCTFIMAAKEFLKLQSIEFFFPKKRTASKKKLIHKFRQRGTELIVITSSKPDVIDDILYTQLKKTKNALEKMLRSRDFFVIGSACSVSEKRICILFELEKIKISAARLHFGPEVNSEHERHFLEKYATYREKLTEPFIVGGRWGIFLSRAHRDARVFLKEFLSQRRLETHGIPTHISKNFSSGFSVAANVNVFRAEFLPFIQSYLDPAFPWRN